MTLCQLFLCFCIRYLHSVFPLSLFFCSVKLTFIHKCLHMFNCTLCEFLLKSQRFFKCMALLQPDINICIEYGCEIYSVNICTIVAANKTKKKQAQTCKHLHTFAAPNAFPQQLQTGQLVFEGSSMEQKRLENAKRRERL